MFSFVASVVIVLNVMEREFLFFKLGKSCFKTTESAMGLESDTSSRVHDFGTLFN